MTVSVATILLVGALAGSAAGQDHVKTARGDPMRVTSTGESAGSTSVSAQTASPLAKDFIPRANGESGLVLSPVRTVPLSQEYFANFVEEGDPNGRVPPRWPAVTGGNPVRVMRLDVDPRAEPASYGGR